MNKKKNYIPVLIQFTQVYDGRDILSTSCEDLFIYDNWTEDIF